MEASDLWRGTMLVINVRAPDACSLSNIKPLYLALGTLPLKAQQTSENPQMEMLDLESKDTSKYL